MARHSTTVVLFYVAHELARCGWTREEIAKELLDKRNGISDHAYRQGDPERAVWERAVNKAFDALEDATTSGAAATARRTAISASGTSALPRSRRRNCRRAAGC